ncbi:unnamed protein product [Orchesella dallaii]|uniref:Uracil-DNA glycosylase-like domain-containing protein n=1 Tax=Orchesella dallaii TaxID=48710 RepID=A0ABP1R485_9HEXA
MVHPFFTSVGINAGLADYYSTRSPVTLKFSSVFSVLFPNGGVFDQNVGSWLNAISSQFRFHGYEFKVSKSIVTDVTNLFYQLGYHPQNASNVRVFQFWMYLVWMYQKLAEVNYARDDNIFEFMRGSLIYNTRLVIIGNDPARFCSSSGYAFHGSPCPSTWQMLEFMHDEMAFVCDFFKNNLLRLSRREMDGARSNCNLSAWISQGVLLLNSVLTYFEGGPIMEAWQLFTDFVISYLSNNMNNIVFMFLGANAAGKKHLVNKLNHHVIELYHPSFYSFPSMGAFEKNLDWIPMVPFLNANFYLYQTLGENAMIDWVSLGWFKKGKSFRLFSLKQFFDFVKRRYNAGSGGWGWVNDDLKVYLNEFGRLSLIAVD